MDTTPIYICQNFSDVDDKEYTVAEALALGNIYQCQGRCCPHYALETCTYKVGIHTDDGNNTPVAGLPMCPVWRAMQEGKTTFFKILRSAFKRCGDNLPNTRNAEIICRTIYDLGASRLAAKTMPRSFVYAHYDNWHMRIDNKD